MTDQDLAHVPSERSPLDNEKPKSRKTSNRSQKLSDYLTKKPEKFENTPLT